MGDYQIPAEVLEQAEQIVADRMRARTYDEHAHSEGIFLEGVADITYAAAQVIAAAAYRAGQEQTARALTSDAVVETAAREAFWTDDVGGHHKPGVTPHTWENIPEIGRENYRTLVRAVLAVAARDYGEQVSGDD